MLSEVTSLVGEVVMIAGGSGMGDGGFDGFVMSRALSPRAESEAFLNRARLKRGGAVLVDFGELVTCIVGG